MGTTNHVKLTSQELQADFSAVDVAIVAENATSIACEGTTPVVNGDWSYSATAEGRTGETPVGTVDMDEAPGFIYAGVPGNAVQVTVKGLDLDLATIAPEATDSVFGGIYVNNTLISTADEGVLTELDDEVVEELNIDTYIGNLQVGDVVRIGVQGLGEEAEVDIETVVGGTISII